MGELATYSLSDFITVTPEVYLRLFVRQNQMLWPLQIFAAIAGLILVYRARHGKTRGIAALLGTAFICSGATFHLNLYSELNWAASYLGYAFILEGLLLVLWEFFYSENCPEIPPAKRYIAVGFTSLAVIVHPLLGLWLEGSWSAMPFFGLAPNPIVTATLGLSLILTEPRWVVVTIPFCWSLIAGIQAWVLGIPGGLVTLSAGIFVLIYLLVKQ